MNNFDKWLKYVCKDESILFLSKRALLEMAFDAGVDYGYWLGHKEAAEWEGLDTCTQPPLWD